jgi:hypothetical protein
MWWESLCALIVWRAMLEGTCAPGRVFYGTHIEVKWLDVRLTGIPLKNNIPLHYTAYRWKKKIPKSEWVSDTEINNVFRGSWSHEVSSYKLMFPIFFVFLSLPLLYVGLLTSRVGAYAITIVFSKSNSEILSLVWVTIGEVWIDNSIYWTLTS